MSRSSAEIAAGNPRLAAVAPSQIRAIAARKRPTSIDLGLGEPTLLPQARFLERATAWAVREGLRYTTNAGDEATRARIAAHYAYPGMDAARNVCLTTGSQEAVYCAITALLDPALDELLVVEPAFPAYLKIAQLAGVRARTVELPADDGFRFDPAPILEALGPRTRMIVLCSPCNPTGRVLSADDVRRLAQALAAEDGPPRWVLHDEIYRELCFVPDAGEMARVHPHTIAVNSLSKSNALTGLRIGWTIAPAAAADAILKQHAYVTSTASAFGQRVAYEIFGEPGALAEQAGWYRDARRALLAELERLGLDYVEPDGGFYVLVRAGSDDDLGEALRLLDERDVVTIPGSIFSPAAAGWLRVSWVAPPDVVAEGLRRIAER